MILIIYKNQKQNIIIQNNIPINKIQTTIHKHTTHTTLTTNKIQTQIHISKLFHSKINPKITKQKKQQKKNTIKIQHIQTKN